MKTMETIEEASSVGVSLDTGGVLILESPTTSAAAKHGLRQGDLIVTIGGHTVKNVADLQRLAQPDLSSGVQLGVYRDQRRQNLKR